MSETTEFWTGDFGNSYHQRNRIDWRKRITFWDRLVQRYGFRSVYEVGCGPGWNLSAIKHSIHGYGVNVAGNELNPVARQQAIQCGFTVYEAGTIIAGFEMVFTAGVLIHIPPEELNGMMEAIVRCSCDLVLAVEYEDEQEKEILYRGHEGKLWKRPYGRLYEELGLTLVETGKVGKADGFDDCMYWLLKK